MEDWGRLAASSHLSWARVSNWLEQGRLLSLVALDALNACWHYNTPLLKMLQPKLQLPESKEIMTRKLAEYAKRIQFQEFNGQYR
jgi:hypothetical protein